MKNKLISISLVFVLILSLMLAFSGCGNSDYPVEVANYVIKSEPENIVVLDPGHGGKDPGAQSNGVNESDLNLTILYNCAKEYFDSPESNIKAYYGLNFLL